MAEELKNVFEENLGYEVTKLGMQANREINQTVEEKTDHEVFYGKAAQSFNIVGNEGLSLMIGEEKKIELETSPFTSNLPALGWESSDSDVVVVVRDGVVRGVGRGSATIKAVNVDDNSQNCSINVVVSAASDLSIAASVVPENSGTVSGAGKYARGSEATLEATAATGYAFSHWGEDTGDVENPKTVEVTENAEYVANFAVQQFTITVAAGENGSVSISGEEGLSKTADYGTAVTIVATPASEAFEFDAWDDDAEAGAEREVTITENKTYTASFKSAPEPEPQGTVSVSAVVAAACAEMGTVSVNPEEMPVEAGTSVTITATPASEAFEFVQWNDGDTNNPRTVVVEAEQTYAFEATFQEIAQEPGE